MVKPIVLDNSALVPLFLPDESDDYPQRVMAAAVAGASVITSSFCLIEFGNTIATCVRRGRLTSAEASHAHQMLKALPLSFRNTVTPDALPGIHDLAVRRTLSFYDALYLHLALQEGATLATLDGPLRQAAVVEGVEVFM